jgi:hypothetical protein
MSRFEQIQEWVSRHKILTAVIIVSCGTVMFKGYQTSKSMRKTRRAKRARNGGRAEVVVIAGSPTLPLTKSLSLDMERRGFIVYIVCNAVEDEAMVQALSRPDIRPLGIDTTDVRGICSRLTLVLILVLITVTSPLKPAQPSNASPPICNLRKPPVLTSNRTV